MTGTLNEYLRFSQQVIYQEYGHKTGIKPKALRKFGFSSQVQISTRTQITQLPSGVFEETLPTTNAIDSFVCDDDSFEGDVYLEGHYFDGNGDKVFFSQTFFATGNTPVTLAQPMCRATRSRMLNTALPADATAYFYRSADTTVSGGVPQTGSSVNLMVTAEYQRSQKCATSLSGQDYFIVTRLSATVAKKTQGGGIAEFRVDFGGDGFYETFSLGGVNSLAGPWGTQTTVPEIIIPNSDLSMFATADSNDTTITAEIVGYLAQIDAPDFFPGPKPNYSKYRY